MRGSRPFTDAEFSQVLETLSSVRDQTLFCLGCRSGFRVSELISLRVRDVFQFSNVLDRVTVLRRHMKKKMSSRTVVLHPQAKSYLQNYIVQNHLQPDDLLFNFGRVHAWRILNKAFTQLELTGKLGTHCMRKTFANKVYAALKGDLIKTQKALGHVSINSTVSYLSFKQEDIDEAILTL